jgi:hypothetical protein
MAQRHSIEAAAAYGSEIEAAVYQIRACYNVTITLVLVLK